MTVGGQMPELDPVGWGGGDGAPPWYKIDG